MKFEQADSLLQAIRSISIRHRALTAAYLASLGLYPGQEVILLELANSGPRTQSELATVSGCEPPTTSVCVRKLESAGLVTRRPSPTDARATIVELTPAGRAMLPELKAAWRSLASETMRAMDSDLTVDQLSPILADLAQSIVTAEGERGVARQKKTGRRAS